MPHFQELKIKIVLLRLQIQQLRVCILDKQEIKKIPIYSKFQKIINSKAIKTIKTMKLVSFWMITFNKKTNKPCLFWINHYTKKTVKNKMLKIKSKMLFSFYKVMRIKIIIQFSFSIKKQPKIKMQFSLFKKPQKFNQIYPSKAL